METPNDEQVADSPEVGDLGVLVKLEASTFRVGAPINLYGSYRVDGTFIQKSHDEPQSWILIIAIRRDQPLILTRPVREKPNLAPLPMSNEEMPGPSFRRGGYFNLDLRQHLNLPDEPGKYWLFVSMGDYLTERLSFQIRN